ncbi:hypothetical protein BSU04_15065 [Caballeronia sordidicola]|uniref:Uncharacterized protein n=1 Tax=Caballeronia sordidicola TaxID=196367 RepID=A0A226X4M9_CABSO|nr:hypothetical protein BSU04_15065 [Caballeronia sordidicola]
MAASGAYPRQGTRSERVTSTRVLQIPVKLLYFSHKLGQIFQGGCG